MAIHVLRRECFQHAAVPPLQLVPFGFAVSNHDTMLVEVKSMCRLEGDKMEYQDECLMTLEKPYSGGRHERIEKHCPRLL
jgi:hypothetical protein